MGLGAVVLAIGFAILLYFAYETYRSIRNVSPAKAHKWLMIAGAVGLFLVTLRVGLPAILSLLTSALFLATTLLPKASNPAHTPRATSEAMNLREAANILGIPVTADEQEINRAWRERMRRYHPDQGGSDGIASMINRAREIMLENARKV